MINISRFGLSKIDSFSSVLCHKRSLSPVWDDFIIWWICNLSSLLNIKTYIFTIDSCCLHFFKKYSFSSVLCHKRSLCRLHNLMNSLHNSISRSTQSSETPALKCLDLKQTLFQIHLFWNKRQYFSSKIHQYLSSRIHTLLATPFSILWFHSTQNYSHFE